MQEDPSEPPAEAFVCGANESGQLLGGPVCDALLSPVPLLLPGVRVARVSLSLSHALLLSDEGTVFSVGDNYCGQCGVHSPEQITSPLRIEALNTKAVATVAAGAQPSSPRTASCSPLAPTTTARAATATEARSTSAGLASSTSALWRPCLAAAPSRS